MHLSQQYKRLELWSIIPFISSNCSNNLSHYDAYDWIFKSVLKNYFFYLLTILFLILNFQHLYYQEVNEGPLTIIQTLYKSKS